MADIDPANSDAPKPIGGSSADTSGNGNGAEVKSSGNGRLLAPKRSSRWDRNMVAVRRWARDTFNREQFVAGLKQLMWVAPLTILIWIYAEREQQVDGDVRVTVEVHAGDPKLAV